MANVHLTAYHTCHLQGSIKDIFEKSPYESQPSKPQWLGNGFYFWTDSDFFAHKWGKLSDKYPKGYAITQYTIQIPQNILLDLVGNVQDQMLFREQILKYAKKFNVLAEDINKIPISKVLAHLRLLAKSDKSKFQYRAIKAVDYSRKHTHSYPFLENGKERLVIPSRQQLYLEDLSFLQTKRLYELYQLNQLNSYNNSYKKLNIKNLEFSYISGEVK